MKIWGSHSLKFRISLSCLGSRHLLHSIIENTDENNPQIELWDSGKGKDILRIGKNLTRIR